MNKLIAKILLKKRWVLSVWAIVYLALGVGFILQPPSYNFEVSIGDSEALHVGEEISKKFKIPNTQGEIYYESPATPLLLKELAKIEALPGVELSPVRELGGYAVHYLSIDKSQQEERSKNIFEAITLYNSCEDCQKIGLKGEVTTFTHGVKQTSSEVIGIIASLIVLYFAFGTLTAALIPIFIALLSIIGATFALAILTHLMSIPDFAPMMMGLLGVGVGIDYTLFILSRHRSNLKKGMNLESSILKSYQTAGVAVIFAGVTVIISLLGILLAEIKFLNGLAIASTLGVFFTLINTLFILPILLDNVGRKVISKKEQRDQHKKHDLEESTFWYRWSLAIQRKPKTFASIGLLLLILLTLPASSLRIGGSDASQSATDAPDKVASEILAKYTGAGSIDPYLVLIPTKESVAFSTELAEYPALRYNTPLLSEDKSLTLFSISNNHFAHTKASDSDLTLIRSLAIKYQGEVGGLNAFYKDTASFIKNKLLWFLVGVLSASSILLLLIFRSPVIMLKATILNLLVAVASFGVLGAVFQWGWLGGVFGTQGDTPLIAFLPIIFLAILFGLAMDYQVFLLSRIKEEYEITKDNSKAITLGLAETGKVITAAALIMIMVFISFAFTPDLNIKMAGVGLASAIFIDAFIVRSLIVPALMQLFGKNNWYLPKSLEKLLPKINLK